MAEEKPREVELYFCNKFPLKLDGEQVTFCNAPDYCDEDTKQRRHCTKVRLVIRSI